MEENIGKKIKKISNLMKRKIEQEKISPACLTKNQSFILGYLRHEGKKIICQKDIEQELSIRRSTTSEMLKRMEKKGLIQRIQSTKDRRQRQIILTSKGTELEERGYYRIEKLEKKINDKLTKEEKESLIKILTKIENILLDQEDDKYGEKTITIN